MCTICMKKYEIFSHSLVMQNMRNMMIIVQSPMHKCIFPWKGLCQHIGKLVAMPRCSMNIFLLLTCKRKWWKHKSNCLVLGWALWSVSILTQLWFSSNILHTTLGVALRMGKLYLVNYHDKCIIHITSRSANDKAIYSASVILSATIVCILDFHKIGHPA